MEKRFVFRFPFFDLKNENEKTNRFSFILLNFLHVKCNCGIVHAPLKPRSYPLLHGAPCLKTKFFKEMHVPILT